MTEEKKAKVMEITDEDRLNIRKWLAAASIMIEARVRTPFSESEHKTADKFR